MPVRANETGYDLWLRYRRIEDARRLAEVRTAITQIVVDGDSPILRSGKSKSMMR